MTVVSVQTQRFQCHIAIAQGVSKGPGTVIASDVVI
jgi:hypothetical protein